jgi:alpha-L-fucosidase
MHILANEGGENFLFVPELKQKIQKAVLFNGKQEVKFKQQPEGTFIYLSGIELNDIDTIIELQLK